MLGPDLLDADILFDLVNANRARLKLDDFEVAACRVAPLKMSKTGGKAVVECTLVLEPAASGGPVEWPLVALWRPDSHNAEVFDLMRRLWDFGFDGRGPDAVCEPIAYFEDCQLMLVSRAPGTELESLLAHSPHEGREGIEAAARWLGALHATPVRGPLVHSYARERELLATWVQDLGDTYPRFHGRLSTLEAALLRGERHVKREDYRLIHGDYHPQNIFVSGDHVTVTDFERTCVFDPAADLGFFLGQLAVKTRMGRYRITPGELWKLRQRFLRAYPAADPVGLETRVSLFEARTFLEVAHYIYCGLHVPPDARDFEFYINSAEAAAREVA